MSTIVSLSAVSNRYLNNDNHLNVAAVKELEDKIQAIVKGLPVTNAKGKVIKMPIPEKTFTVNRRKKIMKFDAAANNRGDLNYLAKRALPVKETKRLTDRGSIRNMALLTIYPVDKMEKAYGEDPFAKLRKSIKEAVSAFNTHMKRADKTSESVKKEKVKVREANNAAYDKALKAFRKVLDDAGVDTDETLVESKGMMGRTVLFKVGKEEVVSIGKADITKFKAAKKAAAESDDEAPKKKKLKKSDKGEKTEKKVKKLKKADKISSGVKKLKKKKKSV